MALIDTEDNPFVGRPLPRRLRLQRETLESYIGGRAGGLAYMVRLRRIADFTEAHERALAEAYANPERTQTWNDVVASWDFSNVNALIEIHNRWYPAESRLPMDPRTGDFVMRNGRRYTLEPLDTAWALSRFPA